MSGTVSSTSPQPVIRPPQMPAARIMALPGPIGRAPDSGSSIRLISRVVARSQIGAAVGQFVVCVFEEAAALVDLAHGVGIHGP